MSREGANLFSARRVPELHRLVLAGRRQQQTLVGRRTIRPEGHAKDRATVAAQREGGGAGHRRGRVPNLHGPVQAGRGQLLAVRAECDGHHGVVVAAQADGLLLRLQVPEPHGLLQAPSGQPLPVAAEGHDANCNRVDVKSQDVPARLRIPDLRRPVEARRGEALAIAA